MKGVNYVVIDDKETCDGDSFVFIQMWNHNAEHLKRI